MIRPPFLLFLLTLVCIYLQKLLLIAQTLTKGYNFLLISHLSIDITTYFSDRHSSALYQDIY